MSAQNPDHPAEQVRARCRRRAIEMLVACPDHGLDYLDSSVRDAITDLLHLATSVGLDAQAELDAARMHWATELAGEL